MRKKNLLVYSFIIFVFFSGSVYLVDSLGKTSRNFKQAFDLSQGGTPFYVANNSREAYNAWKRHGFKGRTFVHVGRFLHFVPMDSLGPTKDIETAERNFSSISRYEKKISYKNYLWVASESNIFRRIFYVLPPDIYKKKTSTIMDIWGFKRIFSKKIPSVDDEPIILNIDASYFRTRQPSSLLAALNSSKIKTDFITFCLSKDSPDVKESDRNKLKSFIDLFEAMRRGKNQR